MTCGVVEAAGLGQPPAGVDGDEQPHQRDHVDEAPGAVAEVGERQGHHRHPGAEPARHRHDAHRVGARVARHLLGCHHGDQEVEGEPERPADRLGDDEQRKRRRQMLRARCTTAPPRRRTVMTRRRPNRSASSAAGRARRIPARTTAPATPMPTSPTPKSSAAKFTVWVNSVLMNAELIDSAATRPRISTWRLSSRSGGAHHGPVEAMIEATQLVPHQRSEQPPEPRHAQVVGRRLDEPSVVLDHLTPVAAERSVLLAERAVAIRRPR